MNYSNLLLQLLPETVLVVAALIVLGVSVTLEIRRGRAVDPQVPMAMAALGIVAAIAAWWFVPVSRDAGSTLVTMDPMASISKLMVLGFGLLAVGLPFARREITQSGEFYALMLFALAGLLLTTGTNHLLFLFVALELASLSLYLLAGFPRTARSAEASLKYFLFGGVSAAFLLFGLSLVYGATHAVTLTGVAAALSAGPVSMMAMTGLVMMLAGLGFKLAAAPFHYWAPDVYQGAPATTVAMVAAASKVIGVVVMIRVLGIGFPAAMGSSAWAAMMPGWSMWIAALAAVSMIWGNVLALAQTSVRRLLAYSAVANTGYILVALAAGSSAAAGNALFYVLVYGLATLGALAVTAAVERERGHDGPTAFAGLIHRSPGQAVALMIFLSSLAGVPPLAGFMGKFALFSSAMAATAHSGALGLAWLVALAVIMSAVSLYYYLSVLKQAFAREVEPTENAAATSPRLSYPHAWIVAVPAFALVVLGVFPQLMLDPIIRAVMESWGR